MLAGGNRSGCQERPIEGRQWGTQETALTIWDIGKGCSSISREAIRNSWTMRWVRGTQRLRSLLCTELCLPDSGVDVLAPSVSACHCIRR